MLQLCVWSSSGGSWWWNFMSSAPRGFFVVWRGMFNLLHFGHLVTMTITYTFSIQLFLLLLTFCFFSWYCIFCVKPLVPLVHLHTVFCINFTFSSLTHLLSDGDQTSLYFWFNCNIRSNFLCDFSQTEQHNVAADWTSCCLLLWDDNHHAAGHYRQPLF